MDSKIESWKDYAGIYPGLRTLASLEEKNVIDFRPYQGLALLAFLLYERGVIRSATGSGKTLIAASITGALNAPTLGVIHGTALLNQTYDAFKLYLGQPIGLIQEKTWDLQQVTLASVDTLRVHFLARNPKLIPYLESVRFLFFDETHHASADTWQQIATRCPAPYRLGMSGTPFKDSEYEDSKLVSVCGPMICDVSTSKLQQLGYISEARLVTHQLRFPREEVYGLKKMKAQQLRWQDAQRYMVVDNPRVHAFVGKLVQDILAGSKDQMLVLTGNSVDLGQHIFDLIPNYWKRDGKVLFVSGRMSSKTVNKAFDRLRSGSARCVIATKLADEGIDLPSVNLLVLVGGGKSPIQTIQRVGRGLRRKGEGSVLTVHDLCITGNKYLERHNKKRLEIYQQEELFLDIEDREVYC